MKKRDITAKDGTVCSCYGELEENSNFELVFEDEAFDTCWALGNPITDVPFLSWQETVDVISKLTGYTPVQIVAV
jgi:hypothetical protein